MSMSISLDKLNKYSYQKVPAMWGPCKQSSFIVVCHHDTAAASERRHCCSAEHTRPELHCCARILKQARVINRPQTIRLTQLCHSIHFRTSCAEQPSCDLAQLGSFFFFLTNTLFPGGSRSVSHGSTVPSLQTPFSSDRTRAGIYSISRRMTVFLLIESY